MSHLSEEQLDQLVAGERAREMLPLNDWQSIAARAREEGIIRGEQSRSWSAGRPWLRVAAAVVLLIGGIAIGRSTTYPAGAESGGSSAGVGPGGETSPVSNAVPAEPMSGASFASVDEASETLERAQADYQRASAFLAANSSGPTTVDSSRIYSARLAALNQVGNAMERALRTAPHDPVINQYYLATMGARVATQQLAARPIGLALKGF
ncbi:MAG: hypothetical protein ACRENK_15280 [Gemmatimonadaceae bacterium]